MKRNWKKWVFSSMAVLGISTMLGACGSLSADDEKSDQKSGDANSDVPTLLFYQVGEAPKNLDQLLDTANKILEKEAGARINMQYIGWGDFEQKMNVITSSGENYDIALATNYLNNAQKGAYADLTELSKEYASETLDYLDQSYIEGNMVNGKLYAIPVQGNTFAQQMFTFNPTFLDKYNLDISNVEKLEDLEPFLKTVHENEPNVATLSAGSGWKINKNIDYIIDANVPLAVDLDGDHSKIINPFEEGESTLPLLKTMHKYYEAGYVPQDAATSQTEYPTDGDTWFVRQETQGPQDFGDYLLRRVTGKEIISKAFTKPIKTIAQSRMANFVISNNSKHKEEAMKVLNELNTNPELLNGLVYGPEGETWEKTGNDDRVRFLDAYNDPDITHMSAWNLANNDILYLDEDITDEQVKEKDELMKKAEASPILGFNFDTSNVKTEITNVNNVVAQYGPGLYTGTLDPDKAVPEFLEKLDKAGIKKIQEEAQKQFDEFLSNKE